MRGWPIHTGGEQLSGETGHGGFLPVRLGGIEKDVAKRAYHTLQTFGVLLGCENSCTAKRTLWNGTIMLDEINKNLQTLYVIRCCIA